MKNYEAVIQWAASVKTDKAFEEITKLKLKYPWLKCDESFQFIEKMNKDLPKILQIIKLQEKQNAINEKFIEVSGIADEAITQAIITKFEIEV